MELDFLPGEFFYGGAVTDGIHQPYTAQTELVLDLTTNQTPNQMMPLLLSTAEKPWASIFAWNRILL